MTNFLDLELGILLEIGILSLGFLDKQKPAIEKNRGWIWIIGEGNI